MAYAWIVLVLVACISAGATVTVDDLKVFEAVTSRGRRLTNWERPATEDLHKSLTPLQVSVTQKKRPEPPFQNDFWNHSETGVFVDTVSDELLFSSLDKVFSPFGWPVFSRSLPGVKLLEQEKAGLPFKTVEVHAPVSGSYLGRKQVDRKLGFTYRVNSAALRFVPESAMDATGLGDLRRALFVDEKRDHAQEL